MMKLACEIRESIRERYGMECDGTDEIASIIAAKLEPVRDALGMAMGAFERNECIDWDVVAAALASMADE